MENDEYKLVVTKGNETILHFQINPSRITVLLSLLRKFFSSEKEKP